MNRTEARAVDAAALAERPASSSPTTSPAVERADLIVNATPVGMTGAPDASGWPLAPELLGAGQVAADLVYVPRPTVWLRRATEGGATPIDGLGMLVHQAAAQLALWTGREAPVEEMWQAAEATFPGDD